MARLELELELKLRAGAGAGYRRPPATLDLGIKLFFCVQPYHQAVCGLHI